MANFGANKVIIPKKTAIGAVGGPPIVTLLQQSDEENQNPDVDVVSTSALTEGIPLKGNNLEEHTPVDPSTTPSAEVQSSWRELMTS